MAHISTSSPQCPGCNESGFVYQTNCLHCDARKIVNLRSPDKRLSRSLQLAVFKNMHQERANKVKSIIRDLYPS